MDEPVTPLAEGAAQAHEIFPPYVDAGFTPEQAMQLLLAVPNRVMPGT